MSSIIFSRRIGRLWIGIYTDWSFKLPYTMGGVMPKALDCNLGFISLSWRYKP